MSEWICPRSILFAPADKPEIAVKALHSQADAVCLDLEDAVAPNNKPFGREALLDLLTQAEALKKPVWVRINSDLINVARDIAALPAGIANIVVPKVQGWSQLQWINEALHSQLTTENKPQLVAMFEDVTAINHFLNTPANNKVPLAALALGTEDLSSDLGVKPNRQLLSMVLYDLIKLGRKLDVPVLGFPDSIAIISDTEVLQNAVISAQQIGASGAFCIHPKQLDIVNSGFMPTTDEIKWAEVTLTLASQIEKNGVATHPLTKRMVDPPVIVQARKILAKTSQFSREN